MANKAKAVIAGLGMLANTIRGLSVRHARILYKSCIIPILSYGSSLWFLGRRQKSLTESLVKVQNQGLRWLLGAFKTTPIRTLEHLSSIPPLHVHLHKINANIASKLRSFPRNSELATRLPASWDTHLCSVGRPLLAKKSPIHRIAKSSNPGLEPITPYLVMPYDPHPTSYLNLHITPDSGGAKKDICKNPPVSRVLQRK